METLSYSTLAGSSATYVAHDSWVSHDERVACAFVVLECKDGLCGSLLVMSSTERKYDVSIDTLRSDHRIVKEPFVDIKAVDRVRIEYDSVGRSFVLYVTQPDGTTTRFTDLKSRRGTRVTAPADAPIGHFGAWTRASVADSKMKVVWTGIEASGQSTTQIVPLKDLAGVPNLVTCSFDHALVQYPTVDKSWCIKIVGSSQRVTSLLRSSPIRGAVMCNGRVFLLSSKAIQCLPRAHTDLVGVSPTEYRRGSQTLKVMDRSGATSPRASSSVMNPHLSISVDSETKPFEIRRARFDRDCEVAEIQEKARTSYLGFRKPITVDGLTSTELVRMAYSCAQHGLDLLTEVEHWLVDYHHRRGGVSAFHPLVHVVDVSKSLAVLPPDVVTMAMQLASMHVVDAGRYDGASVVALPDLSSVWIGDHTATALARAVASALPTKCSPWPVIVAVLQRAWHRHGSMTVEGLLAESPLRPVFTKEAVETAIQGVLTVEHKVEEVMQTALTLAAESLESVKGPCLLPIETRPATELLVRLALRLAPKSSPPMTSVTLVPLHGAASYTPPEMPVSYFDQDVPMSPVGDNDGDEKMEPASESKATRKRKAADDAEPKGRGKRARNGPSRVVPNVHLVEPTLNRDGSVMRFALEVLATRYLHTVVFKVAGFKTLPDWDDEFLNAILVGRHAAVTRAEIRALKTKLASATDAASSASSKKSRAVKRTPTPPAEQIKSTKAALAELGADTFEDRLQAAIRTVKAFVTSDESYATECKTVSRGMFDGHLLPHEALTNLCLHMFPEQKGKSSKPSKSKLLQRPADSEVKSFEAKHHSSAKPDDDVKKSAEQPGLLSWLRALLAMKYGRAAVTEELLAATNKTVEAFSSVFHPYMMWLLTTQDVDFRSTVARLYDVYRETFAIDRFGLFDKSSAFSAPHRCYWEWYRFNCHPDAPALLSSMLRLFPTFMTSIAARPVFGRAMVPRVPWLSEFQSACDVKCQPFSVGLTTWLSPTVQSHFWTETSVTVSNDHALIDPFQQLAAPDSHADRMLMEIFGILVVYVLAERKPVPALADIIVAYDNMERAYLDSPLPSRSPRFRSDDVRFRQRCAVAIQRAAQTGKEAKVSSRPPMGDRRSQRLEVCKETLAQVPVLRLMQRDLSRFLVDSLSAVLDYSQLSLTSRPPSSSRFEEWSRQLDSTVEFKHFDSAPAAIRAAASDVKHPWCRWLTVKHLRAELGARHLCQTIMQQMGDDVDAAKLATTADFEKMAGGNDAFDVKLASIVLASPSVHHMKGTERKILFFDNLKDKAKMTAWIRDGELQPFHVIASPDKLKSWRTPELLLMYRRYYMSALSPKLDEGLAGYWQKAGRRFFSSGRAHFELVAEQPSATMVPPTNASRFQTPGQRGFGVPSKIGRGRAPSTKFALLPPAAAAVAAMMSLGGGSGSGSPASAAIGDRRSNTPPPGFVSPVSMLKALPATAHDEDEDVPFSFTPIGVGPPASAYVLPPHPGTPS